MAASILLQIFTSRQVDLIAAAIRSEMEHCSDKDRAHLKDALEIIRNDTLPKIPGRTINSSDDLRQLLGMKDW